MQTRQFFNLLLGTLLLSSSIGSAQAKEDSLIVAGGCFWCVESDFEKVAGVLDVASGYTGGTVANPSYEEVSSKKTGHFEAALIKFDDEKVSLESLFDYYWRTIDPTDPDGQFCDKGSPYRTGLFYQTEQQRQAMEKSLQSIKQTKTFDGDIVTQILPAKPFYPAEDYHQDYYKKNPIRYNYYRYACGRDERVKILWGDIASKKLAH